MNRITEKYDDGSYGISECTYEVEKKLGQLEDLEEKLGIDLITYVKLTQYGFTGFIKDDEHKDSYLCEFLPFSFLAIENEILVFWQDSNEIYCIYKYSDYGKTWALTKEELEDDK